ncbi:MAG: hypothetical protein CMO01_27940 [Thalassobius sp.]|nr:hypothetical protein [Thalassovita sp.]
MSKVTAIIIGSLIWLVGVSFYALSASITLLADQELQANITLAIILIPGVWLGTHILYKITFMYWLKAGSIMLSIAILLDACITVPYFIIPYGGTYQSFFGAPAFWLLAIEYILIVYSYWKFHFKNLTQNI